MTSRYLDISVSAPYKDNIKALYSLTVSNTSKIFHMMKLKLCKYKYIKYMILNEIQHLL